jgi:hypothetical protein
VLLIIDEIHGIKDASEYERLSFLLDLRSCREYKHCQALQSSIIVSNYTGEYLNTEFGSPFNRISPPYFTREQVRQLYDEEYGTTTDDQIVNVIYKESNGAPGLTQIFGGLYHSERIKLSPNHVMSFSEWSQYFYSSSALTDVLSHANYYKMMNFFQTNKDLALLVAKSIITGKIDVLEKYDVEELLQNNILKPHSAGTGYCMANSFISRVFDVFYQSKTNVAVDQKARFGENGYFNPLDLLANAIPAMNPVFLCRTSKPVKRDGVNTSILKPKQADFVHTFKMAAEYLLRFSMSHV